MLRFFKKTPKLEVRQFGVPASVAEHELARHVDLTRQLAADGDPRLEPRR